MENQNNAAIDPAPAYSESTQAAAAPAPASTSVPAPELKQVPPPTGPAAGLVPPAVTVDLLSDQIEEPQNALTRKFSDSEWEGVRALRVSQLSSKLGAFRSLLKSVPYF